MCSYVTMCLCVEKAYALRKPLWHQLCLHVMCSPLLKHHNMEKRSLGVVLSVLGIVGLVLAAFKFVNGTQGTRSIKEIITYAILGALFFFAGIGLVRSTHDKAS